MRDGTKELDDTDEEKMRIYALESVTIPSRFESSQRRGGWEELDTGDRRELNFSLTAGRPRVGSRKRTIAASRFGSACLMSRVPGEREGFLGTMGSYIGKGYGELSNRKHRSGRLKRGRDLRSA
jgi:hypothetical protein